MESIYLYTNVGYDNISSKFDFQDAGIKIKVIMAVFRKKTVIALEPSYIGGF